MRRVANCYIRLLLLLLLLLLLVIAPNAKCPRVLVLALYMPGFVFCPEDDGRAGQYDVTERIRQLNAEMAKERPLADDGPSQPSVKFKDKLVDFVSPTPEPQWDSEEDVGGSSQNTPRTDEADSPGRRDRSDPVAASSSDVAGSSSTRDEDSAESDPRRRSLTVTVMNSYFQ